VAQDPLEETGGTGGNGPSGDGADPGAEEKMSFEAAMARLEQIVRRLEESDLTLDLDASLALFEEGTRLVARCQRHLDAAETRIQKLTCGAAGPPRLEPLTDGEGGATG